MIIKTCKTRKPNSHAALFLLTVILLLMTGCKGKGLQNSSEVFLLVNSETIAEVAIKKLIPYLGHYGVKFTLFDIAENGFPLAEYQSGGGVVQNGDTVNEELVEIPVFEGETEKTVIMPK